MPVKCHERSLFPRALQALFSIPKFFLVSSLKIHSAPGGSALPVAFPSFRACIGGDVPDQDVTNGINSLSANSMISSIGYIGFRMNTHPNITGTYKFSKDELPNFAFKKIFPEAVCASKIFNLNRSISGTSSNCGEGSFHRYN